MQIRLSRVMMLMMFGVLLVACESESDRAIEQAKTPEAAPVEVSKTEEEADMTDELHVIRFEPQGPEGVGLDEEMKLDPNTDTEPVAGWHRYYADETGSVRAGVFKSKPMTTELQPHSSDEFMHIIEGAVTIIDQKGHEETFRAGDSLILPKGMPHIWKQTGPLRKFFFSYDDPSGAEPTDPGELRVIRIDPNTPLTEIPVDPSRIERGTPTWYVHNCFSNMTGRMNVGIFATTEFHENPWKVNSPELMHILEGSVTFTNGAGAQMTFNKGDTLISQPGMTIKWDSEGYAKKIYCSVGVGH